MKLSDKGMVMFFLIAFVSGLVFFNYSPVCAQEDDSGGTFTLEEITVTAQKREENQQKVPIAMDVISGEDIREFGKDNIEEILSNISGAIIQKAADGYRVSIRGMSDDSSDWSGQSMAPPTVAINTDGVYSNRKDTASALFDVERVEVLYGPQSTLYSSTSPGGIINVVTAQPKLGKYEASGSLEAGNYNLLHTEGVLNAPLGDKTAIRASFSSVVRDGYVSDGSDNEDSRSARFRALFQPRETLSFTVTTELSKDKNSGFGGVVVFENQDDVVGDPWTAAESDQLTVSDQTSKKLNAQMAWDTSYASISLIPAYFEREGDRVNSGDDELSYSEQEAEEKSIELRMTSPEQLFFKWIVGFNYYDAMDFNRSMDSDYVETSSMEASEETTAYYLNITYPVMDNVRVTAGYRQSWDTITAHNIETMATGILDEVVTQENPGNSDYKVGFEYDLAANSMIYGDYATSYRVQGMSRTSTGPTELKAYSLGAKNRFFDNRLQLNASAYYYDYSNYQANQRVTVWVADLDDDGVMDEYQYSPGEDYNPNAETAVDPNAVTAGDGRVLGIDMQLSAVLTEDDMLNLSVSYIDSEWTDFTFDYYYDEQLAVVNGEVVTVALENEVYDGKPMFTTPPWTVNLNYSHNFNLTNGGVVKAALTSKYQSHYRLSWKDSDDPYNYQEAFHMENISMSYRNPDGKWTLSAYVNNIFDYADKRMYQSPMGAGVGTLWIGNPRTYGAVFTLKY